MKSAKTGVSKIVSVATALGVGLIVVASVVGYMENAGQHHASHDRNCDVCERELPPPEGVVAKHYEHHAAR